jgi:hypothetical protein
MFDTMDDMLMVWTIYILNMENCKPSAEDVS